MLNTSEFTPTETAERCDILSCLIDQAQEPVPTDAIVISDEIAGEVEESIERGWIYSATLRELVTAMDGRLDEFSVGELAQVFDFPEIQVWANTTRSIPTIANSAVAMRNAAFLLIQLKAMGFRIDDTLLSARLRPLLARKRFLVGREFYVFWQEELEAKREAFVLYVSPLSARAAFKTLTLPAGHEMRVAYDDGHPIGVEVAPPASSGGALDGCELDQILGTG